MSKLIREITVDEKKLEKSHFEHFFQELTDLYVRRSITVNSSSARISTSTFLPQKVRLSNLSFYR